MMPFIQINHIGLTIDDILRSIGIPRTRTGMLKSSLPEICGRTLETMKELIEQRILYRVLPVLSVAENGFRLEAGIPGKTEEFLFGGPGLVKAIPGASCLIVILITLGPELERKALELSKTSVVEGYTLDCAGGAALRYFSDAVCFHFEKEYARTGLAVSHPYDPGMDGWPVEQGQREIFSILDGREAGVVLNGHFMMIPQKSVTMVLGVGEHFPFTRRSCHVCSCRDTCVYKVAYASMIP